MLLGSGKALPSNTLARFVLSMAPYSGLSSLRSCWESHVPLYIQYMAAIIVAMMAYTLILSMMPPSGHQSQPRPEMIVGDIPFTMDQIAEDVKSMEEHNKFLRSVNP